VVSGQLGFGFDADEKRRPASRGHNLAREVLAFERQGKCSFLKLAWVINIPLTDDKNRK
jgi:hypothetical protein